MKKVLFATLCCPLLAIAHPVKLLNTYTEALTALQEGHIVRAVVNLQNCTTQSKTNFSKLEEVKMGISGGFNFSIFNHHKFMTDSGEKDAIGTSIKVFADIPGFGLGFNHVLLRLIEDNTAYFRTAIYSTNYLERFAMDFNCPIGPDLKKSGVRLFDMNA